MTYSENTPGNYRFPKSAKLKSPVQIAELFRVGNSFISFPLLVHSRILEYNPDQPVGVVISVSRKRFPRAVDRNTIKRIIREAYRLNASGLPELNQKSLHLGFTFIAKELQDYPVIEKAMIKALKQLRESILP